MAASRLRTGFQGTKKTCLENSLQEYPESALGAMALIPVGRLRLGHEGPSRMRRTRQKRGPILRTPSAPAQLSRVPLRLSEDERWSVTQSCDCAGTRYRLDILRGSEHRPAPALLGKSRQGLNPPLSDPFLPQNRQREEKKLAAKKLVLVSTRPKLQTYFFFSFLYLTSHPQVRDTTNHPQFTCIFWRVFFKLFKIYGKLWSCHALVGDPRVGVV